MKEISLLWRWRLRYWAYLVCQQMKCHKELVIGWIQEKKISQSSNV